MGRKRATIKVAGMNRDLSMTKFQPDFSYENLNIRVSARDEDNTMASISNERGTKRLNDLVGTPVGTFVCDNFLGVFSFDNSNDYIYVYQRQTDGTYDVYYRWEGTGLGFSDLWDETAFRAKRKIETEVTVEASNSIRVYWVDGIHPPRVIDFKRRKEIVNDEIDDIDSDYFLFLPKIEKITDVNIDKRQNGYFYSGTVQFCITEVVNRNESNIAYYSPLYYCSTPGASQANSPENVEDGCSFRIEWDVANSDNIDYFIVYAIYRSSQDGAPVVVKDEVKTYGGVKKYNTLLVGNEETVDPSYLQFKNSAQFKSIGTIAQQDNTLFLGNIDYVKETEKNREVIDVNVTTALDRDISDGAFTAHSGYRHKTQLDRNSFEIGHFKYKEKYALGFQFMDKYGHWGEPYYIKDLQQMNIAPSSDGSKLTIPSFKVSLSSIKKYKGDNIAVRPVVAYIDDKQKRCLYQGIVTPTIFCESERARGECYAKFSPFARTMKRYSNYRPDAEQVNPNKAILTLINKHTHPKNREDVIGSFAWASENNGFVVNFFNLISTPWYMPSKYPSGSDKFIAITMLGYGTAYKGYLNNITPSDFKIAEGTYPSNQHFQALGTNKDYNGEIQTSWYTTDIVHKCAIIPVSDIEFDKETEDETNDKPEVPTEPSENDDKIEVVVSDDTSDNIFENDNTKYYVDTSVTSFHSPDIKDYTSYDNDNRKVDFVGAVSMKGFVSDTNIVASAPHINEQEAFQGKPGFHKYQLTNDKDGRCAMTLPSWQAAWAKGTGSNHMQAWAVNPFSGEYLATEEGVATLAERETSKLEFKQLSNYRYSNLTAYYDIESKYETTAIERSVHTNTPMTRYSERMYIYKGEEDVVVVPNARFAWSNGFFYSFNNSNVNNYIANRIGYGSFPYQKISKITIESRNNLQNCFALIQNNSAINSLLEYNFATLPSVSFYNHHKGDHPTYKGFWRGKVYDRDEEYLNDIVADNQSQNWYHDDRYNYAYGLGRVVFSDEIETYGDVFEQKNSPASVNVNLKYKSWDHFMLDFGKPIPNTSYLVNYVSNHTSKVIRPVEWKSNVVHVDENKVWQINEKDLPGNISGDALWLVDIINNDKDPDFTPSTAKWMIGGEAVYFDSNKTELKWTQGDWYFQRYDCLRTYAETPNDLNQVTEIVSFLVETRTNIDGRYDKNRGYAKLNANPSNYNLINSSYTQQNNYFSYSVRSLMDNVVSSFPVSITWSLPKVLNSNVDVWTNITSTAMLDFEGDKGAITKLIRFRNNIYCFQPSGISQVLYNSRTQLATAEGMPVEIANSGKVESRQYISNNSGAVNNYNVVSTDNAMYYVDAYNKTFSALNDNMGALSETLGFHSWLFSHNDPSKLWCHIDSRNTSIMLAHTQVLSYNEKHSAFESFYNYEKCADIANIQEDTLLLHKDDSEESDTYYLWSMNKGLWNNFFGKDKMYYIDYIVTTEIPTDKVFDNTEYRGDLLKSGDKGDTLCIKKSPFNMIQAYHEYQDSGVIKLTFKQYALSNMKNKFRTWHTFIPRNKFTKIGKTLERIRNSWAHIKMIFNPEQESEEDRNYQALIQDFNVDYFE